MRTHIGNRTREVVICDMVFEVGSGIDLWDGECWKAWVCDSHGEVILVGDGATREEAEDNVIELVQGALCAE
jgi:hypothetical protein